MEDEEVQKKMKRIFALRLRSGSRSQEPVILRRRLFNTRLVRWGGVY